MAWEKFRFQMLLYSLSLRPEIEVHYARGRSDLEVEVCNCRWVFEYKYSVDGQNLHQLLEEAKSQIIDRRYGQSPNHSQETIYVAAVFDGSQRRIGAWAEVKQNWSVNASTNGDSLFNRLIILQSGGGYLDLKCKYKHRKGTFQDIPT